MEEEEVAEEEMQQVVLHSENGETYYVKLPSSVQIGENNIVTTETTEGGQQVLRVVEVNPYREGDDIGMQVAEEGIAVTAGGENLPELPQVIEAEEGTPQPSEQQAVTQIQNEEQLVDGGHNLELFQHAMALLQKKSNSTATTIVTGPNSGETVYIVHDSGENISMETAEVALNQADGTQIMVLAPPEEGSNAEHEATVSKTTSIEGKENAPSAEIQMAISEITDPAQTDTVKVVKRKRGRPRKIKPPISQSKEVEKAPVAEAENVVPDRVPEITSGGRPRRRAAQKFLESCKALNMNAEQEIEESVSPPPSPLPMSKPQPPRLPLFKENKENVVPLRPSNQNLPSEKDPTTVNIKVGDKSVLEVIDDIGIHMMYYCRRCTFFSKRLQTLARHVADCRLRELTDADKRKAQDACLSNAILSSAALKGIASTDLSAIQSAGEDCIPIDEHNYAEVEMDEGQAVEEAPRETVNIVDVPELPEELRPRKWFCLDCPDVIYGEKDLEIHRKCHGENGLDPLHCYVCAEEKGKIPVTKYAWTDVRKHLRHYHDINFEIICLLCSEVFPDHLTYNQHVLTHGQHCPNTDCDFVTDTLEVLSVHQNSHIEGSKDFSCCVCKEVVGDWLTLRDHMVRNHPGMVSILYNCTECEEPFQEQHTFQEHMTRNTTTGKFGCHLCTESFYLCAMPRHLRVVHADVGGEEAAKVIETAANPDPEPETEPSQLEEMAWTDSEAAVPTDQNKIAQDQEDVSQNVNAVVDDSVTEGEHPVGESEQGDGNGRDTDGSTSETIAPDSKRYRCHQHELVFFSQADLTKHHVEVHWGVTKEKVAQAEEERKRERENKAAVQVAVKRGRGRPRKNRSIDYGDDDTKDPEFKVSNLSSHRRIRAEGFRSSRCRYCYKSFNTSESLSSHINRCHTPDKLKPVECRFCGKFYRNGTQLRNHVRVVHEGVKRAYVNKKKYITKKKTFMCETCGYTTPELNRLTNHRMSVHEGYYPYQCSQCDYKTNERADMKRHEHKHQGIKRYNCTFCSYKSDQRWLLVNHCSRQHGIQLNRLSRNTRGTYWSNRKKRREEGEALANQETPAPDPAAFVVQQEGGAPFTQEIVIGGGVHQLGDGYFVPMVTTNEHGEESVAMVAVGGGGSEMTPGEVSVETVEEDAKPGEVVYIQDDGTIIDPEEAAIMLVAVAPDEHQAAESIAEHYTQV